MRDSIVAVRHALSVYPFPGLGIENGVDAGRVPDVAIYVKKPVVNPLDLDRSKSPQPNVLLGPVPRLDGDGPNLFVIGNFRGVRPDQRCLAIVEL